MASTSGKNLLCFFHVGGNIVYGGGQESEYIGGMVRTRNIKEGTTYKELLTYIASVTGEENTEICVKCKLSLDTSTFVDLVDDEGVEHLIRYNETYCHVYVEENGVNDNRPQRRNVQMEEQEVRDEVSGGAAVLSMAPPEMFTETQDLLSLPCSSQSVPLNMPEMNHCKWKELIMGEGQIFANAITLRETLYKFSIAHKFAYIFVKNKPKKIIVKCKVDGCPWYMGAYSSGERQDTAFLIIRTYRSEHIHHAQDSLIVSHPPKSNLTSSLVIDGLRCNIDKTTNEIRTDLYSEYGVRLNYCQSYRAKQRAVRQLHGRVEDSYKLIPWLCDRLIESDPDTVAKWEGSPDNIFERLFIAYGCSIKGFLNGCRPILYIDGCHLSGPYRGTMLSACTYDADNEMFPLAYGIVSGETYDDWAWFLNSIKQITGSMVITTVSDRNNSIIGAVKDIFGTDRHAFCYRHVKENYSSEFLKINKGVTRTSGNSKELALQLLDVIAYARPVEDFTVAMGNLKLFNPKLAQWVETQGDVDQWALSKFPFKRWDNITTNIAESFNAWMVKERKHNIGVLIHEHREKLTAKLLASKMALVNWKNGVGPNIEKKLQQHVNYAENIHATYYGENQFLIEIRRGDALGYVVVDLDAKECSCLSWQMSGLPCPHACAAIKKLNGSVYAFVEDCFKIAAQEKIYAHSMRPIATHDSPCVEKPTVTQMLTETFLEPPITTRSTGRPRKKRKESQFQDKKVYHCGRCHEDGHTVKTCKNPNPS